MSPAARDRAYDWITAVTSSAAVGDGRVTGDVGWLGTADDVTGGGAIGGNERVVSAFCCTGVAEVSGRWAPAARVDSCLTPAAGTGAGFRFGAGVSTRRCVEGGVDFGCSPFCGVAVSGGGGVGVTGALVDSATT